MKEKIAYLRGLMEGMQLADDNNGKLMRAIADCLEAIADEVEVESARTDVIEAEMDDINEELENIDEVFDALIEDDDEDDDDEDDDEEEFGDDDEILFHIHDHPGHQGCCHGHGHHHHGGHHGCCHGHHGHWDDDDDELFGEGEFNDLFNYFTCPTCGEIVPITDDMLAAEADPICPRCNGHIFGPAFTDDEDEDETEGENEDNE